MNMCLIAIRILRFAFGGILLALQIVLIHDSTTNVISKKETVNTKMLLFRK